jgi:multiple sugar transport system ATP-binding protein
VASVELREVSKSFGSIHALMDVSFTCPDGATFVLLGPSGAGKTTTLRAVAGLTPLDAGNVHFDGRDVTALSPRGRNVAMTFEDYALYPHLKVAENIGSPLRARRLPKGEVRGRVEHVAAVLGIEGLLDRRPGQLSGGQRQRVALGRTLVREDAEVLLLDEALSHLDAQLQHRMRGELQRLFRDLKQTVLYTTHDYREALALGDVVGVLRAGQIEQVGHPDEIFYRPRNEFVGSFVGRPPMNFLDMGISSSDGGFVLEAGSLRLDLPSNHREAAHAGRLPGRVRVGIRPRFVRPAAEGSALQVVVSEPVGRETVVTLEADGIRLRMVSTRRPRPQRGEIVRVSLPSEHVVLFDESGERIDGLSAV